MATMVGLVSGRTIIVNETPDQIDAMITAWHQQASDDSSRGIDYSTSTVQRPKERSKCIILSNSGDNTPIFLDVYCFECAMELVQVKADQAEIPLFEEQSLEDKTEPYKGSY